MRNIVDASKLELTSTIVNIRRVSKTVKGGKNMRFSVTVVVGDGNGYVGVGLGKSIEIPEAVRKADRWSVQQYLTRTSEYSEQAEFSSCPLHRVPELSQDHPHVQYLKLPESRT